MSRRSGTLLTLLLSAAGLFPAPEARPFQVDRGRRPVDWKIAFDHGRRSTATPGATIRPLPDGTWLALLPAADGAVGIAACPPLGDLSLASAVEFRVRSDGALRVRPFSQSSGWVFRESGGPDHILEAGATAALRVPCESMADPSMVETVGIQIRRRDAAAPAQIRLLEVTVIPKEAPGRPGRPVVTSVEAPASAGLHAIYTVSFVIGRTYDNPYDPAQIDVQAEFRLPSGASVTVPAFWFQDYVVAPGSEKYEQYLPSGNPVWKVRFLGTQIGLHSFRIRARDRDGNPEEAGPYEFGVEPSRDPGGPFASIHPTPCNCSTPTARPTSRAGTTSASRTAIPTSTARPTTVRSWRPSAPPARTGPGSG